MQRLILARHGQAASNISDAVNGVPPGEGLSPLGTEQAVALGSALADVAIGLYESVGMRHVLDYRSLLL